MKVFAIEFSGESRRDVLIELIEQYGYDVQYFTGGKRLFERNKQDVAHFGNTVFHHYLDALAGISAPDIDETLLPPIGSALLEELSLYEGQVIAMMERLNHTGFSYLQKRALYHRYVWYWHGVLNQFSPDAILFSDIPHTLYNYVIYRLAKRMGIPTIMYKGTKGFPDRMQYLDDFEERKTLVAAYQELKSRGVQEDEISASVRAFYEEQVLKSERSKFSNMYANHSNSPKEKTVEVVPRIADVIGHIKRRTFFLTLKGFMFQLFHTSPIECLERASMSGLTRKWKNLQWKRQRNVFQKEYDALVTEDPSLEEKYVYLPLHYQPEGSTNPMAGVFDNQLLMVDLLAAALPEGWKLYVKENAHQWDFPHAHLGRYSGYYQHIVRHKNVVLVPTTANNLEIISHAHAIGVATGTTGVEGLMRGKPVLLFGYPWYRCADAVFPVSDIDSCRAAMQQISAGAKPSKISVLRLLEAVETVGNRAYLHRRHGKYSKVNYEENVKNIASGLHQELQRALARTV